jgi:hypothetical protein
MSNTSVKYFIQYKDLGEWVDARSYLYGLDTLEEAMEVAERAFCLECRIVKETKTREVVA